MKTTTILTLLTALTTATLPLPHHTITQFPPGTWIENIAVRPNGNLLLTTLTPNASLYEVLSPFSTSPSVALLFTIPTVTSLMGITETVPDTFAVVGGNFSAAGGVPDSYALWTADFSSCEEGGSKSSPKVSLVTTIPDAVLLNGATTASGNPNAVLVADSQQGKLFRVDIARRKYSLAAALPEMAGGLVGINGVHMHKGYLYWTNDEQTTVYRARFTPDGGLVPGAGAERVANVSGLTGHVDDFMFGPGTGSDTMFVATNQDDVLLAVGTDGKAEVVVGGAGDAAVGGSTSCAFGRTGRDGRVLYVATEGGKVEAVEVGGFGGI